MQKVEPRGRNRSNGRPAPVGPHPTFALRDARRGANREGSAFLDELSCECARPDCRARFPAHADAFRRHPQQFIVVPEHLAGDWVVAVADRFFVVE